MTYRTLSLDALAHLLRGGSPDGELDATSGPPLAVVDLDGDAHVPIVEAHSGVPIVIVGLTSTDPPEAHPAAAACDVILGVGDPALDAIVATVGTSPIASTALALLLRGSTHRPVDEGLLLESAVYSTLQSGPELAAWLAVRPARTPADDADPIALERTGGRLEIVLSRPHVRNALNRAMRDALTDAFRLVALDDGITEVHLRGDGPSFCSGGDLDEFGSFPDPATAHLVRLQQSVGRAIFAVRERVTAHLHGACAGSGIELPAFAATVLADPSTTIGLPEVALGLIPGAGGTVSPAGPHR
jgi:hypothetical protein